MSTDMLRGTNAKYSTRTPSAMADPIELWIHDRGEPRLTRHALVRWDQRTPDTSVSPERAWLDGVDIGLVTPYFSRNDRHPDIDEVRYHDPTDALFLRCDNSVVTVLLAGYVDDPAVRAFIRTRGEEGHD